MALSNTTAAKVIKAAEAEIRKAVYNRPNKYTKWFSDKYGKQYLNAPWCGIFVSYIIQNICNDKVLLEGLDSSVAAVGYIYNWAKKNNYIKMSGKKGDLIIFDWSCGNGVANSDHVGFFVKDNKNGTITTIEGNTSSVSDGNGNHVQQRIRDKKWVRCYVRLPYKITASFPSSGVTYDGIFPTSTLSSEIDNVKETKYWQQFLHWAFNYDLKVDGQFGTMTYKVTKEFQELNGLETDGIVGPKTLSAAKSYKK